MAHKMTPLTQNDKDMIVNAGADFYRNAANYQMDPVDLEMRGEAMIDKLYAPWLPADHNAPRAVSWDDVEELFWQGFDDAKAQSFT